MSPRQHSQCWMLSSRISGGHQVGKGCSRDIGLFLGNISPSPKATWPRRNRLWILLHVFACQSKIMDIKVKHAASWTSLGKMIPAPTSIKSSSESFRQFQKAALEKEESEWAKERKRQLEQSERKLRNLPQEKERHIGETDLKATAGKASGSPAKVEASTKEQLCSPQNLVADRNLARKMEQERRRREALTGKEESAFIEAQFGSREG
ncbi:Bromodomain testis-specific protein [Varanus komodoensis]|nr:Bromodomain testis-specific protein [Varanus komodoensis]